MEEDETASRVPAPRLPRSVLQCGVCLSLVCEPVSISCGHTFCRTCLVSTLRRSHKRCPCCRAVCYTRAEDQPQNVMIAQAVKACFPDLLERRLKETEAEKAKYELCLPAFFFNVPMFPGEVLSLHFFEPRYKLMMKRIIDTSRRFAYVPNYSNYVASKGDTALVAQVCDTEFLSDGRVLVKTKLVGRYTVEDHFVEEGTQGLHYCQLEPYEDAALEGEDLTELEELHSKAQAACSGFLGPFKSQLVQSYGEMPSNVVAFSMWMASFLPFYTEKKQALLESRCTRERLRACLQCVANMEAVAGGSTQEKDAAPPPTAGASTQSSSSSSSSETSASASASATVSAVSSGMVAGVGASAPGPQEAGVTVGAGGEGL